MERVRALLRTRVVCVHADATLFCRRRHYLEYKQLKKQLKKVIVATRDDTIEAAHHEQEGFKRALDSEVTQHIALLWCGKQRWFAVAAGKTHRSVWHA